MAAPRQYTSKHGIALDLRKLSVRDFRASRFAAINLSGYGGDKFTSKALLRIRVALLHEQLDDFGLEVALDDDFSVLG